MGDLERSLLDALYQTILADKDDVARCTALIFLEEHGLHVLARWVCFIFKMKIASWRFYFPLRLQILFLPMLTLFIFRWMVQNHVDILFSLVSTPFAMTGGAFENAHSDRQSYDLMTKSAQFFCNVLYIVVSVIFSWHICNCNAWSSLEVPHFFEESFWHAYQHRMTCEVLRSQQDRSGSVTNLLEGLLSALASELESRSVAMY